MYQVLNWLIETEYFILSSKERLLPWLAVYIYLRPIGLVQLRFIKVTYALEFQLRHCVVVKPLLLWVQLLLSISL